METMRGMTLAHIARACDGIYYGEDADRERAVTAITIDSRKVCEGCLFAAIVGERSDGHEFIRQSYAHGAIACLSEKPLEADMRPYILVKSSGQALKAIAESYRAQFDIPFIGIAGSVGKTSTKEMVASVLSEKYHVLKTEGNFNNELGVPLTLFRLTRQTEAAVVEMGISDFGEMHRLGKMVRPDICVMTNIADCHLEQLGDRKGVLRAKSEILDYHRPGGALILNGDDELLARWRDIEGAKVIYFGQENKEGCFSRNVESLGLEGMRCEICMDAEGQDVITVHIPIPGRHAVYNAMAAAQVGRCLGLTNAQIQNGIARCRPVEGRNNIRVGSRLTLINGCYNANPASMRAAFEVLSYAKHRKVAVLGDMFELGAQEIQRHYETGIAAAEAGVDVLLLAGPLSENIARGARDTGGCTQVEHYETREALQQALPSFLQEGDAVLVKASHGMKFQLIAEQLQKLDHMVESQE